MLPSGNSPTLWWVRVLYNRITPLFVIAAMVRPSGETLTSCGRSSIGIVKVPITVGARRSVASSVPSVCGERSRFSDSRASSIARSIRGCETASAPSSRPSATFASCCACERDTSASAPATIASRSSPTAPARSALSRRFWRRCRASSSSFAVRAGVDELALELGERDRRVAGEQLELREVAAPQQVARLAAGLLPLSRRRGEASVEAHLLAAAVDPAPEAAPLAHERLVRDLDRRRPAARVAVEREQPPRAELLDRLLERGLVDLHRGELRALDAPARVLGALAERDEPEEELARRLLRRLPEAAVDLLGPAGERPGDAADRAIGVARQRASLAPLVELGQRVLEQRQRARLVGDVGHELGEQARLEPCADALRRAGDRALELVGLQRDERLDIVAEQLREAAVEQRPVVEVGAERDDDAQPRRAGR